MKKYITLLLVLFAISLDAQVPNSISWQGILQDASGNLLNGQYDLTVKIYNVSSGGSALWTEAHNDVQINEGLVNFTLGEITTLTLPFSSQYWLEITIDAGTPLTRIKLASVPYSLNAAHAESVTESDPKWSGTANQTSSIGRTGRVGIGTTSPSALLHTYGIGTGEGNVLFEGSYKSSSPGNPPTSGAGTRMMWYPDKAAFRAGYVDGTQWDKVNIGDYSIALGFNTKASGFYSVALGNNSITSGFSSIALGNSSLAINESSTAIGYKTNATGYYSTAFGNQTTASGSYSIAIGNYVTSPSAFEIVTGRFNTNYTPNNIFDWNNSDRLFVIGNGTGDDNRKNAMTVLKNGKTGIGTDNPAALLHTSGTGTGEGNVLFTGSYKSSSPGNPPTSGAGTRLMWYPDKGAFRAGSVSGTEWDFASIGQHSSAMGSNTTASGYNSTAMGFYTTASGNESVAMGYGTTALDDNSIAMGHFTYASGYNSTAMGYYTTASGNASVAMGWLTTAKSFCETVLGIFNTDYTPISATTLNAADRLFVIGNGSDAGKRSNAVTVLKNGCVGLQTVLSPSYSLELPNNSANGKGRGRAYSWDTYSDGRLKSDRQAIPYGLSEIMKLEPIKYFHHNSITENGRIIISYEGAVNIGFIAQDIYKVIPEIVSVPENDSSELWGMSYEKLTPVLVKALQEQQEMIEKQNQKIEELEKKLEMIINSIQSNK